MIGRSALALAAAGAVAATACAPMPSTSPPVRLRAELSAARVVRTGLGFTSAGLDGPRLPAGSCRVVAVLWHGQANVLPDRACTPGAVDTAVTEGNLAATICRPGYSETVRPPGRLTEPAKRAAMAAYGLHGSPRPYELDHLVPLELGGSNDTRNLWPERNIGGTGGYILNAKDAVEADLHQDVCDGRVSLTAAQEAIAYSWTTATRADGDRPKG